VTANTPTTSPPATPPTGRVRRALGWLSACAKRLTRVVRHNPDRSIAVGGLLVAVVAAYIAYAAYRQDQTIARADGQEPAPSTPTVIMRPPSVAATPDPRDAYERCEQMLRAAWRDHPDHTGPIVGAIRGRVAIMNSLGTTVVISDNKSTWSCNVKPDLAISRPGALGDQADSAFALAHKATVTDPTGPKFAAVFWGGGTLPLKITALTFVFPNGQRVAATVKNGYWALQYYYPSLPANTYTLRPIRVLLIDADGQVHLWRELRWIGGEGVCNAILRGC
jgi:hypothetical protein